MNDIYQSINCTTQQKTQGYLDSHNMRLYKIFILKGKYIKFMFKNNSEITSKHP